jgi:hypothetical protein
MDNHIVEIQKNPLGGDIAFHTQKLEIFPAAFLQQEIGQTLGMARRRGGDEDSGHAEILFAGKIQGEEIRGLFFPEKRDKDSNLVSGGKSGKTRRDSGAGDPGMHGTSMDAGSGKGTFSSLPAAL